MPITELISSHEYTIERTGTRTARRVWLAQMPAQAAIAELGLVVNSTTYPDDPTLTLRTVDGQYQSNSPGYSQITATYDNGGPWGGAPVAPTDPTFRSWSVSYQERRVVVPRAFSKSVIYAGPDGEVTNTFRELNTDLAPVHTFTTISRRTVLTSVSPELFEYLGELTNTLQKIGNRWYRFTVGDMEEVEPNRWTVTYTFENDPGTLNIWAAHDPAGPIIYPSDLSGDYSTGLFARPPFYNVRAVEEAVNPTTSTIRFEAEPAYIVLNQNAWQTLPGFN
jgi:hypothetical protein